jgi:hypothetical protein
LSYVPHRYKLPWHRGCTYFMEENWNFMLRTFSQSTISWLLQLQLEPYLSPAMRDNACMVNMNIFIVQSDQCCIKCTERSTEMGNYETIITTNTVFTKLQKYYLEIHNEASTLQDSHHLCKNWVHISHHTQRHMHWNFSNFFMTSHFQLEIFCETWVQTLPQPSEEGGGGQEEDEEEKRRRRNWRCHKM